MDKCCFDCKSFERTKFTQGICNHVRSPINIQAEAVADKLLYVFENVYYTFVQEADYSELEKLIYNELKLKNRNKVLEIIMEKVKETIIEEVLPRHESALINESEKEKGEGIAVINDGAEMVCKYFN